MKKTKLKHVEVIVFSRVLIIIGELEKIFATMLFIILNAQSFKTALGLARNTKNGIKMIVPNLFKLIFFVFRGLLLPSWAQKHQLRMDI